MLVDGEPVDLNNDAPVVEDVASAADEDGALVTASFDGDDVDTD